MKRLVIFGNTYQQGEINAVLGLFEHLRQHGIDVAVEQEYLHYLSGKQDIHLPGFDANQVPDADMALSLGGDGTLPCGFHVKACPSWALIWGTWVT